MICVDIKSISFLNWFSWYMYGWIYLCIHICIYIFICTCKSNHSFLRHYIVHFQIPKIAFPVTFVPKNLVFLLLSVNYWLHPIIFGCKNRSRPSARWREHFFFLKWNKFHSFLHHIWLCENTQVFLNASPMFLKPRRIFLLQEAISKKNITSS